MAIVKTDLVTTYAKLQRGAPFSVKMTLYTRSDNKEDPKDYLMYKINNHKATTIDKRTTVHFLGDEQVNICNMERKEEKKKTAA